MSCSSWCWWPLTVRHCRELRETLYTLLLNMQDVGTEIPIKWLR